MAGSNRCYLFDSKPCVKAHFHQNKAKAGMSIYHQFKPENCVKYKHSEVANLHGAQDVSLS